MTSNLLRRIPYFHRTKKENQCEQGGSKLATRNSKLDTYSEDGFLRGLGLEVFVAVADYSPNAIDARLLFGL